MQRVFATSSGIRVRIRFALTSAQQRTGNPRKSLSDNVTKRLCDAFSSSREGSHVYAESSTNDIVIKLLDRCTKVRETSIYEPFAACHRGCEFYCAEDTDFPNGAGSEIPLASELIYCPRRRASSGCGQRMVARRLEM